MDVQGFVDKNIEMLAGVMGDKALALISQEQRRDLARGAIDAARHAVRKEVSRSGKQTQAVTRADGVPISSVLPAESVTRVSQAVSEYLRSKITDALTDGFVQRIAPRGSADDVQAMQDRAVSFFYTAPGPRVPAAPVAPVDATGEAIFAAPLVAAPAPADDPFADRALTYGLTPPELRAAAKYAQDQMSKTARVAFAESTFSMNGEFGRWAASQGVEDYFMLEAEPKTRQAFMLGKLTYQDAKQQLVGMTAAHIAKTRASDAVAKRLEKLDDREFQLAIAADRKAESDDGLGGAMAAEGEGAARAVLDAQRAALGARR
jgi:hypothetical protein